ncbi:hypothetical protein HGA64_05600 [Candidatus Falkowbacteria bacterium]|nr:hypothetical protein [Candidatus Falkowbacteria bacterium]
MTPVDNDSANFATGYLVTDINGDNLVDLSDIGVVDTNNLNFVSKVIPSKLLLKGVKSPVNEQVQE